MASLIALIAGNGSLAKSSIVTLAAFGAVGVSLGAWEHGWLKAPIPIGTPVRGAAVLLLVFAGWAILAFAIWPRGGSNREVAVSAPVPSKREESTTQPVPKSGIPPAAHKAPPVSKPKTEALPSVTDSTPKTIQISAMFFDPQSPDIVITNSSDQVAEGVGWSLVAIRRSDLSYFGFVTQSMGYIKPHRESAKYGLELDKIPKGFDGGDGQIHEGDELTGSISIDCPRCEAQTYIIHLVWKRSGWFFKFSNDGGYILPKDMSADGRAKYIDLLTGGGDRFNGDRIEISPKQQ